jgi:hypothetical protein
LGNGLSGVQYSALQIAGKNEAVIDLNILSQSFYKYISALQILLKANLKDVVNLKENKKLRFLNTHTPVIHLNLRYLH